VAAEKKSDLLDRVKAKAVEKGVDLDPAGLKPASEIEVPEKPQQPAHHNHAFEIVDGVRVCSCGGWIDDSVKPPAFREEGWTSEESEPETLTVEHSEPEQVQVVTVPADLEPVELDPEFVEAVTPLVTSDRCPKCKSELVGGECWECM
jgi:hypothetical protein